ncbi:tyrosine-type recombinase/integrase [Paraburkholderia tropica]|uniref:tyrosine-type recombinase/integrase n=1 Tax=Paraburkholderia tropica TaxID=92647 RepID=UPI003D2879EB
MPIEATTKNGERRYRWTFERVIEGKRVRKTKLLARGLSARQADELARKWEAKEYAKANGMEKATVTIGECVRVHVQDEGATWKDKKARGQILVKYAAEYQDQDAMDLYKWSVAFADYMRSDKDRQGRPKRPSSAKTINNTLGYIRAAIKYAHVKGLIPHDETGRMVMPKFSNERHIYEGRRTMLTIAKACKDKETRAAVRIAFYSGMRMSEILRAKVTARGFDLGTTKNGRPRIVPIHPKIAATARRIRFTITAKALKYRWTVVRARAGFDTLRFHDLRHSAASEMINAGVDLYTVGGVLGHKTAASTKRYAHLVTDKLAEAVNKIGKRE